MDSFIKEAKDKHRFGTVSQEKEWLTKFFNDVQTFVYNRKISKQSCVDVALALLDCLVELIDSPRGKGEDTTYMYSLLEHHSIISLKHLASQEEIYAGHLSNNKEALSREDLGFPSLTSSPPYNMVAVGYLTFQPSLLQTIPNCGSLFLEDNSSFLPIEMINPSIQWLNRLVVLPNWTFIPFPRNTLRSSSNTSGSSRLSLCGYLEAPSGCVPIFKSTPLAESPVESISLTTYREQASYFLWFVPPERNEPEEMDDFQSTCKCMTTWLQRNRDDKREVNLHGKISAISPVHSMANSKPFFFIQLMCNENNIITAIVVQGEQHMYWHHFIHIDNEYVFTSVRETTMNKGTRNERKVLATSKHSKFHEQEICSKTEVRLKRKRSKQHGSQEKDTTDENTLALKRQRNSQEGDPTDRHSVHRKQDLMGNTTDAPPLVLKVDHPLTVSYTGVLTQCVKPEAGVYELDGRIKLYINHQPCVSCARGLRVGAQVSLYNVHLCKRAKNVLGFCCCTLSCVRVAKFSSLSSPWKPLVQSYSPYVLHGQNLPLSEYVNLLQVCEKLHDKLLPLCRSNEGKDKKSIIEKLLLGAKNSAAVATPSRNIYREFFDQPHLCHPTRLEALTLPNIPTIKEFCEMIHQRTDSRKEDKGTNEWRYYMLHSNEIDPKMALIGCLRSSPATGSLQLYDQTGTIVSIVTRGSCLSSTQCDVYPWIRDCMVQLDVFDVIVEHFETSGFSRSSEDGRSRIYIQVALEKVQILMRNVTEATNRSTITQVLEERKTGEVLLKPLTAGKDRTQNKTHDKDVMHSERQVTEKIAQNTEKARDKSKSELPSGKKVTAETASATDQPNSKEGNRTVEPSVSRLERKMSIIDQHTTFASSGTSPLFTCEALFIVRHRENLSLRKKLKPITMYYTGVVDVKVVAVMSPVEFTLSKKPSPAINSAASDEARIPNLSLVKPTTSCNASPKSHEYPTGKELEKRPLCGRKDASSDALGRERNANTVSASGVDLSKFSVKRKSICLKLHDQTIVWHPFLYDGCFYILRESSTASGTSMIMRAMRSTGQSVLEVTPSMRIEQVFLPNDGLPVAGVSSLGPGANVSKTDVTGAMKEARQRFAEEDGMASIVEVLSSTGCKKELPKGKHSGRNESAIEQVNFRGRVVCRELRLSETAVQQSLIKESIASSLGLGFSYLGNKTVFLRVQDLGSPNTMDVYVDLSRTPYVDGILPGSIIQCRRFLRKISRAGNMYCSFGACSSLIVEQAAPTNTLLGPDKPSLSKPSTSMASAHQDMSNVPRRHLNEFIKCQASGNRLQTISRVRCRVTAVQRVTLGWQCVKCGHAVIRDECSGGCLESVGFRFSAEARCLVEDGTAEAQVYLSDDTIPVLLRLSSKEMSQLQCHAMGVGELVYQRFYHGSANPWMDALCNLPSRHADAKRLLADSCCSPLVKRSIVLYCKHIHNKAGGTRAANQTEGYESRGVTLNQTEHSTLVLPKLLLKALDVTEVNYVEEIRHILSLRASHSSTTNT